METLSLSFHSGFCKKVKQLFNFLAACQASLPRHLSVAFLWLLHQVVWHVGRTPKAAAVLAAADLTVTQTPCFLLVPL